MKNHIQGNRPFTRVIATLNPFLQNVGFGWTGPEEYRPDALTCLQAMLGSELCGERIWR